MFESPEFSAGINIIVGDNGSGKSTFSYLIEYGLGGNVKQFKKGSDEEHVIITQDFENYVILELEINNVQYELKRFIGANDIFISKEGVFDQRLSLNRNGQNSDVIFSDWLLQQLGINVFELNMGTYSWKINFNDLYRLLNYDQDTSPAKIYKSPSSENFVTDSVVIRKAIFETLIGLSSQEYSDKFGELRKSEKLRDEANALFKNYVEMYSNLTENKDEVKLFIEESAIQLDKLYATREKMQQESVSFDDKANNLAQIQEKLISIELETSKQTIRQNNLLVERGRIERLIKEQNDEILQIEKIIHAHNKLNLFSFELCPFCGVGTKQEEGACICGSTHSKDYEKFVYTSSEYGEIIGHKKKSLETINLALKSYNEELEEVNEFIAEMLKEADSLKDSLRKIISRIEYSGNSDLLDQLNNKIIELKESISENEQLYTVLNRKKQLEDDYKSKKKTYDNILREFKSIQYAFEANNKNTIDSFNIIFSDLMKESTCDCESAIINEDYMPIIDGGVYKEKSARVPIRLMYYFTFFAMGLKYKRVKHPHLLVIDTPESEGIDEDNLKTNLLLLDTAINKANEGNNTPEKYQVIMTTGYGKYPDEYEKFIKLRFNKKDKKFIFTEKSQNS